MSFQKPAQAPHEIDVKEQTEYSRHGVQDVPLDAKVEQVVTENRKGDEPARCNRYKHQGGHRVTTQPLLRERAQKEDPGETQCQRALKAPATRHEAVEGPRRFPRAGRPAMR